MKKLSILLAFVLLFSFCLGACGQTQLNPKLDDLNKLCDTLEKNHYNLYANVSEEEFQAEREKIARQTAKMSDEEFYWATMRYLALAGRTGVMEGPCGARERKNRWSAIISRLSSSCSMVLMPLRVICTPGRS